MSGRPSPDRRNRRLALEASAAGLAYTAGLCWASVCLLASFRPDDLSTPYWRGVPGLRSDSCGILAFFATAVCLATSEYLRLGRRRNAAAGKAQAPSGGPAMLMAVAVAETVAVLATGLTVYLSVNAVTHPATLRVEATHLAGWPTEGTLRVVALLLCACSVAVLRCLLAASPVRST